MRAVAVAVTGGVQTGMRVCVCAEANYGNGRVDGHADRRDLQVTGKITLYNPVGMSVLTVTMKLCS